MRLRSREVPSDIPTASMADVAFLLIIFFLVASFYSVTRGIQFSLPKKDEQDFSAAPEEAVLIEIGPDSSIRADGRPLPLQQLQHYLRPKLIRNPTKSVILQTSLAAPYAAMTDVFDELRAVGVENLVIPTSSELSLYGLERAP
jgi:biopolymer transport protein ExbD